MSLEIIFYNDRNELFVQRAARGNAPPERITMRAFSGGWQITKSGHKALALPTGKWLITDDPNRSRRWNYFGLFHRDGKINDQFLHRGVWRNGIRFGFHYQEGSHGCIMTMPLDLDDQKSKAKAQAQWTHIQELVRTEMSNHTIEYVNDQDPVRSDPTKYRLRAYGDLIVRAGL